MHRSFARVVRCRRLLSRCCCRVAVVVLLVAGTARRRLLAAARRRPRRRSVPSAAVHLVCRQPRARVRHAGGVAVRAVAAGEVTFSGTVAGERYVVVRHNDGRRATYGGLAASRVAAGERSAAGVSSASRPGICTSAYATATRTSIRPVARPCWSVRPRLVPDDGTAARAAPPPRLRCGGCRTPLAS